MHKLILIVTESNHTVQNELNMMLSPPIIQNDDRHNFISIDQLNELLSLDSRPGWLSGYSQNLQLVLLICTPAVSYMNPESSVLINTINLMKLNPSLIASCIITVVRNRARNQLELSRSIQNYFSTVLDDDTPVNYRLVNAMMARTIILNQSESNIEAFKQNLFDLINRVNSDCSLQVLFREDVIAPLSTMDKLAFSTNVYLHKMNGNYYYICTSLAFLGLLAGIEYNSSLSISQFALLTFLFISMMKMPNLLANNIDAISYHTNKIAVGVSTLFRNVVDSQNRFNQILTETEKTTHSIGNAVEITAEAAVRSMDNFDQTLNQGVNEILRQTRELTATTKAALQSVNQLINQARHEMAQVGHISRDTIARLQIGVPHLINSIRQDVNSGARAVNQTLNHHLDNFERIAAATFEDFGQAALAIGRGFERGVAPTIDVTVDAPVHATVCIIQ